MSCVHPSAVLLEMPGSLQNSSLGLAALCVYERLKILQQSAGFSTEGTHSRTAHVSVFMKEPVSICEILDE